ncbi:GtrA family protein [Bailinhaonella thermotolerans]|uniref:GtrA family protein n=1 Tax=Bailinhaonella thermotolerans TaxID=1070861 RepID=A0A3A4BGW6_9ACTN|nr:GtrA family protein [Bailinhaonella thermotolerans]RJL30532.1 GtrA family protein [Bailinhaonella thermotolerans]
MKIVQRLYQRFTALVHELAKFGVVGALAFVITWGVTNLLHYVVGLGPLTSNVFATVIAATFAYFGNRFWTWRHREKTGLAREYFLFFVFNGIGLLITLLFLGFRSYTLKLDDPLSYQIAFFLGTAVATLFRFWSYKKWVFLPPDLPPVDPHTGLPEPIETYEAASPTARDPLGGTVPFEPRPNNSRNGNRPHVEKPNPRS